MSEPAQSIIRNFARVLLLVVLIAGLGWRYAHPKSRIPQDIRAQTPFTIIVPSDTDVTLKDWRYSTVEKNLSYTAYVNDEKVVVTQQKAPLAYRDDKATYDRFVGTLRPVANFQSPLGTVSIFHLFEEGTYVPQGDSAVLLASDTLLIAHPTKAMTDDDWAALFRTVRAER